MGSTESKAGEYLEKEGGFVLILISLMIKVSPGSRIEKDRINYILIL